MIRGGGYGPANPDGHSDVAFMLDQCHNVEDKIPGQIRSVLNVQEMTARALLVDRDALAAAQEAGDVLGVVSGDFAVVGSDVAEVADAVLDRLLSPTAELVTLVVGDGADHTVAQTLSRRLREERVDVDVVVYEGGQENYPLFVAVE